MRSLLLLAVLLCGCDGWLKINAPCGSDEVGPRDEILSFEVDLSTVDTMLLNMKLNEVACPDVEAVGLECKIPENVHSLQFFFLPDGTTSVSMEYLPEGRE